MFTNCTDIFKNNSYITSSNHLQGSSTKISCLAGGFSQSLSTQVFPSVPWGGAVGRGCIQNKVLTAGSADNAWR